jgi:hypothetical protein
MKSNKGCPSYDCGFCETFPTPSSVKCGGEETKNCKWLDFNFYGAKFDAKKDESKRTMFDLLKELPVEDFAYRVAIDNCGDCRGVCAICKRNYDGDCDDKCVSGIIEYFESEVKE